MALKKPKEVPEIPKSREKSIDKLKKAKPAKKKTEIEFNCRISFIKMEQMENRNTDFAWRH